MEGKQKEGSPVAGSAMVNLTELPSWADGLTLQQRLERMEEWARAVIYDSDGKVLATTFDVDLNEIDDLLTIWDDEEDAFRRGIDIAEVHYDVHRFYESLIYGRRGGAKTGDGVCICRTFKKSKDEGDKGKKIYSLITYEFPTLSAKTVPVLQEFCNQFVVPLL